MAKFKKETAVGLFVLVGLLAVVYMSVKLGNVNIFTDKYYTVKANFTDISGLKQHAPVQMFGVKIGYVENIALDQEHSVASVTMLIEKQVKLTDDAIVSVKTNGLIGDKYLKIAPGGLGDPIKTGDTLFDTNPAIDLEDLISKFAFGDVTK
ncbi:outer membrane lipid asymmetry maintenance protein MlaD [Pseudodesulfovibrio sp. zrk46]|uniref:outer membrane lipid asymmetry maintenance protein MlaD n=1 Tax=Pseudodesulfovibrio sp. zrk46 TaxID=2725288 RepID=UPI0014494BEB|nr:outer membrane lipid asymmetry maintenance protein MlaD [Pseudodesulfovibrio sp. zrk46]QJB55551.1 outer membrane lipid asymmetry maintenance protein MlaD [Pseudodesulfovibrio sp. zrk46]